MGIFFRQTENKQNIITDYVVMRFERLLRLREIAMNERNVCKKYQADRLISATTAQLNARYHHQNQFNFN